MTFIKANFSDFEYYKETFADWELDFRLLSKNNFNVAIKAFMSDYIHISRTTLSGTVEQLGLTPKGFRSIAIPAKYSSPFVWLRKKVDNNNILIFPKNGDLDGISYHNFDVYVIDVNEMFLLQLIDDLGYKKAKKIFKGDEQKLTMSQSFAIEFSNIVESFFKKEHLKTSDKKSLLNDIFLFFIKYIEFHGEIDTTASLRRRDVAIIKAVDLINGQTTEMPTIQQICAYSKISERTLEYAFLEKYKVTPSQYIKAIRLNLVKKELIALKDTPIKISTIAGKYDFWHMGQFAKDFKNQFGVLPSQI